MSKDQIKKQNSDSILCSAGRGEIAKDNCLLCARRGENECGFDFALLNALYKDKEREGIHVTDLTGCLRQAYYGKVEAPLEHPHEMMARFLGSAVHKHIESFPASDIFDSELALEGLGLVGTADIVYKDGRIVDFKTTRWLKKANLPYGSHVRQLNIYAALLRAQGREVTSAALQYIDMSGASKCVCKGPVKPGEDGVMVCVRCGKFLPNAHPGVAIVEVELEDNASTAEWIKTRLALLTMSMDAEIAPEPEASYLCDYCPFLEKCTAELGE